MNILIIVLDSYRADTYWEQGPLVSPELWNLHEDFVAYRNAHTTTSWTLPSHTTLFTGLYPSEHGKHSGAYGSDIKLPDDLTTLAELAQAKGYVTAGFSSNPWVGENSGLNQGFDLFVESNFKVSRCKNKISRPFPILSRIYRIHRYLTSLRLGLLKRFQISRMMTDGLLSFIEDQATQGPFFAFINLMDPHNPYQPPAKLLTEFTAGQDVLPEREFNYELSAYISGKRGMDEILLSSTQAYYRASLAHSAQQVGRTIDTLKKIDCYDNTAIFICSDHGKTLGEYGRCTYPLHYITDINTHILLLAKSPCLVAGEQTQVVSLIDIFYSILTLLDESVNPNHKLQRPRLEDRKGGNDWVANGTLIPFTGKQIQNPDLVQSITNGRFKYVYSDQRGEILWDKHVDPTQMKNMILEHPDVLQVARNVFREWQQALVPDVREGDAGTLIEEMDAEVLERLRALGYL